MTPTSAPGIRLTDVEGGNVPWQLQQRVVGFSLSLQANASDRMVLTVYNDDLALFGHQALQHGTMLDIRWGYAERLAGPRRVFFEDFKGCEELTLEFSGAERTLNREAHTRVWTGKTVAQVVREIAELNGFTGPWLHVEDASPEVVSITQAAETDAALLQRLALAQGFRFSVGNEGLHWERPKKFNAPSETIRYALPGASALSLTVTSNQARQPGRVEVRTRDPIERRTVVAAANSDTPRDTLGQTIEVIDPMRFETARQRQNASAVVRAATQTASGAMQEASTRFAAQEAQALEIRTSMVGAPSLEGGQVIRLETPAPYLNGNYFVQEAKHIIDAGGYRTELHLTRDGGGPREGTSAAPQGGTQNTQPRAEPTEVIEPRAFAGSHP